VKNALKRGFPPFLNEQSLRAAIESVCAQFGKVTHLKILPPTRHFGLNTIECECYLRLDSQTAEAMLKLTYLVKDIAGCLHFLAEVDESYVGPHV
jgi:hypothetical protein